MNTFAIRFCSCLWALLILAAPVPAAAGPFQEGQIYDPGHLKPVDSVLKVAAGDPAPDFTLRSVAGPKVTLGDYRGEKNVVLSFVPAAWTPVCSDQWPGYNIARDLFEERDAILLGISVDNIPTLHAWTLQMGHLWFPVLSDFWPHGAVADRYGILRSDGTAERAIIIIDKAGIIRYAKVSDINVRPKLEEIIGALDAVVGHSP
jgi:peroxiredoxin (alkyl hydroperoxide reductase subunit C)